MVVRRRNLCLKITRLRRLDTDVWHKLTDGVVKDLLALQADKHMCLHLFPLSSSNRAHTLNIQALVSDPADWGQDEAYLDGDRRIWIS